MGLFSAIGKVVGGVAKAGVSALTGGAVQLGGAPKPAPSPVANAASLGTNLNAAGGTGVYRSDLGVGNLGAQGPATAYDALQTLAVANAITGQYNTSGNVEGAILARLDAESAAELRMNMGILLGLAAVGALAAVVGARR